MGNCVAITTLENSGIFTGEEKTFDALLKLLYTQVGYNTYMNPWEDLILEIDPQTGYAKWIFRFTNGQLVPNHMDGYGCIDKIIIVA